MATGVARPIAYSLEETGLRTGYVREQATLILPFNPG
jgi:hypothetical protein